MEVLNNIKIIFIDIDKTLLTDKKRITMKTRKSIKKVIDKGIYVILTSGRNSKYTIDKSKRALASSIVISSNGAEIYDYKKQEVLHCDYINYEKLEKIWNYCEKNEIGMLLNSISDRFINKFLIGNKIYNHHKLITTYKELKKINVSQCVLVDESYEKFAKSKDFIKDLDLTIGNFTKSFNPTFHSDRSMNIINKNVSKGTAVTKLLEILDIKKEESLCFGDYLNDLEMFDACGYKVAMENACKEIKEKADYITLSNNKNGISHFLDNFIK